METLFTWVHLSDLHVRAPREDTAMPGERILAALRDDLEAHAGDRVDAILVSGDVAWSGQREEYVAADALLVHAARALGLGPERVYVIPGNHDVDRSDARAPMAAKLVADLRQGRRRLDAALEHARAREVLASRLYAFGVFAATFGPPPADGAPIDGLWWSHRLDARDGSRVRLVGLCTAFLADGDADRGALRLGETQLREAAATIAPGEIVIALSHHPAHGGWLADERDLEAWLREHAHLHVSGHLHDPIAEEARAGLPGPFVWIAAGALPPKRKLGPWTDRGFGYAVASIVRSPDGSMSVRVTPRRWSPEDGCFVEDARRDTPLIRARPEPIVARPEPINLDHAIGDPRRFAADLTTAGLTLRRKGNVAEAIDCLKRALAIHEKLGEMDGRADILGGLGLCFRDVGEFASSVDHFRRALAIHEERGDRTGEASTLGNLGNTYRAQGEIALAVEHLERALAIYEELDLPDGQGAALSNLGLCYRALGQVSDARDRYERAIDVFQRLGLPDEHPHVRMVSSALGQLRAPRARAVEE